MAAATTPPTAARVRELAALYKRELYEEVLPFWIRHSLDRQHGGYFTCLDDVGAVFDTDKFIWLQARQVWCFATIVEEVVKAGGNCGSSGTNNTDEDNGNDNDSTTRTTDAPHLRTSLIGAPDASEEIVELLKAFGGGGLDGAHRVSLARRLLEVSLHGADFLRIHAHDGECNWYFSLDAAGVPLTVPYNIFSYVFAALAFGQAAKALQVLAGITRITFAAAGTAPAPTVASLARTYAQLARTTFEHIVATAASGVSTKGPWEKAAPESGRKLRGLSLPMMIAYLAGELRAAGVLGGDDGPDATSFGMDVDAHTAEAVRTILEDFWVEDFAAEAGVDAWAGVGTAAAARAAVPPPRGVMLEAIRTDGTASVRGSRFLDCMEGRVLNPGHAVEAMWFVMDIVQRGGAGAGGPAAATTLRTVAQRAVAMLEHGWDHEHGGVCYFLDVLNRPLQQLEWDQKLWWVHVEALICMAKAYQATRDPVCWAWFERLHAYTWAHFRDARGQHTAGGGEWFGYLHREGHRASPLKGGKWKGCFHVPRGLLCVHRTLDAVGDGLAA